jgi:hypothetical protein
VGKTQAGGVNLSGNQVGDERGEVLADGAVDVLGRGVGHDLEGEAGDLGDGGSELGVGHGKRRFGLVFELVEEAGESGRHLALA